jgi:hypothetical protein
MSEQNMGGLPKALAAASFDEELVRKEWPTEISNEESHFWCLHCHRVYRVGRFRMVDGLFCCPYEGCDGNAIDAWAHSEHVIPSGFLPERVEEGRHYEMYPEGQKQA